MAENWKSNKSAFAYFDGARARNARWAWSARTPDDRTVVINLWKDRISDDGNTVFYQYPGETGKLRLGNKDRIENLKWARDHLDGLFRVVVIVAKDIKTKRRSGGSIAKRYPEKTLVMKLISLDEHTGEFRAESVSR